MSEKIVRHQDLEVPAEVTAAVLRTLLTNMNTAPQPSPTGTVSPAATVSPTPSVSP